MSQITSYPFPENCFWKERQPVEVVHNGATRAGRIHSYAGQAALIINDCYNVELSTGEIIKKAEFQISPVQI